MDYSALLKDDVNQSLHNHLEATSTNISQSEKTNFTDH